MKHLKDMGNLLELLEKYPTHKGFRTGLQGVEGEFWYYESHFKGFSFKFVVPKEFAEENQFTKVIDVDKLKSFVLVKGVDYR